MLTEEEETKGFLLTSTRKYGIVSSNMEPTVKKATVDTGWFCQQLPWIWRKKGCFGHNGKVAAIVLMLLINIYSLFLLYIFKDVFYLFDLQPEILLISLRSLKKVGSERPRGSPCLSGAQRVVPTTVKVHRVWVAIRLSTAPPPLWNINAAGMNF